MSNLHEIPQRPSDAISSVRFSPDGNTLAVGSWDSSIYIYKRNGESFALDKKIECDSPVLDVCWNADNATIYSVGLDHEVAQCGVEQGAESRLVLSTHQKACNKVAYSPEFGLVLSTSWDESLHVHDAQRRNYYVPLKLAAKPFALSLTKERVIVAMAERKIHVYDLAALKAMVDQTEHPRDREEGPAPIEVQPWQTRESSLKFMTRDIACMPDGTGFAASSIEGRVGVEWFGEQENKQTYAFKCHREKTTVADAESGETKPMDIIYPVNAVAFHPVHGTFATGGGDGVVALWDAKTKRRIRQYPKLPASVAALDFSADGKMMAVGISPGFEDGKEEEVLNPALIKVYVRELADSEAKGKAEKAKKAAAPA